MDICPILAETRIQSRVVLTDMRVIFAIREVLGDAGFPRRSVIPA